MARFASLFAAGLLASTVVSMAMAGCSNQGEGERCDLNNNNDDCQSGLTCQNIAGQPMPLCCPLPPKQPTVPECFAGQTPLTDGGTEASTTQDAAHDTATVDSEPDVEQDAAEEPAEQDATEDAAEEPTEDAAEEPADDAGTGAD